MLDRRGLLLGLLLWSGTGILCGILFALADALSYTHPHFEGTYTSFLFVNVMQAAFFLIVGSPFTLTLEWLWTRMARTFPSIERSWLRRVFSLTIVTFFTAGCLLILTLLILEYTTSTNPPLANALNNVRANQRDLLLICTIYCIAVVMPRVMLPSLRRPIFR